MWQGMLGLTTGGAQTRIVGQRSPPAAGGRRAQATRANARGAAPWTTTVTPSSGERDEAGTPDKDAATRDQPPERQARVGGVVGFGP